ncbi:extracellular tyrosine-protein kinase PKDCC isoform X2 [Oryzias melastigma]|uniref:extracellular tyrosine-protein kinase PKDCC isoform X2 n=1 Tax=Oryzias melastigma TaxID=30732 RepID=UPI00168D4694|nr:extracellular tyrosine-protein kinase PKDCC isoform X2 [Oryzias melastigma]
MVGSLRAAALLACVVLCALLLLLISGVQQFGAQLYADDEEVLLRQLKERRRERNDPSGGESRLLVDSSGSTEAHLDEMGCEALVGMQALEVLGSGYTKLVFKASLSGGQSVALKLVNEQGIDMKKCLEEFRDPEGCRELISYKLEKEMILLRKLQHPNVIKLKGHCAGVQGGRGVEAGRLAIILERGDPLQMIQLLQSPWEDRFRVCLDLVRLLHFLSRSPLGSIGLLDFQPQQFVTVSGELKLTDLDDGSAEETPCQTDADCTLQFPQRNFSVACSAQGSCERLNEKRNIYNAYRYFFTYLLPHQAPPRLTHLVDHIMNSTGELKADVNQTLEAFEHILHLYESGLHLDDIPASILRDARFPCRQDNADLWECCRTSVANKDCQGTKLG